MMFVKMYKIVERYVSGEKNYYLSEITLNTNQITYMSENLELSTLLREGKMNLDLNEGASFSNIRLSNGNQITVIGNPAEIQSKIMKSSKKILRG